jgi:hypothetical protein
MKTNTFGKCVLVAICLLQSFSMKMQGVTINTEPWGLSAALGSQKDVITDLTLTGSINANDVGTLRSMANLTTLNMSGLSMVAGGTFWLGKAISVINNQIPEYMFFSLPKLTSVILPNNVTAIGNQAFQECSGLTSVTLGSSLTTLGIFVFGNCSGLKLITLPPSLTTINNRAFWNCTGLTSITIPASVNTIGDGAFTNCSGLKEFIVSDANLTFSSLNGVLLSKNKLTLIAYPNSKSSYYEIPASITTIKDFAFGSCLGLSSVVIGNGVTTIGEGAFYNCTGLVSVIIGSNVTSIPKDAFYNCNSLTSLVIPNSVKTIGWGAFGYCQGLTSLDMGTGLTYIDIYAFNNCKALTSITIPGGVTTTGDWAFSYCIGLKAIHSRAATPPTATDNTFNSIDKYSCKLYVPIGYSASYKGANGWSSFASVIEEFGVSVPEVAADNIKVYTEQNAIIIEGASTGDKVLVYNEAGALIQMFNVTDAVTRIYVPVNRIYLIKVTSKTFKVAL